MPEIWGKKKQQFKVDTWVDCSVNKDEMIYINLS